MHQFYPPEHAQVGSFHNPIYFCITAQNYVFGDERGGVAVVLIPSSIKFTVYFSLEFPIAGHCFPFLGVGGGCSPTFVSKGPQVKIFNEISS